MLTGSQRHAFFASLAGWSLDAFDFFIFVFCLRSISAEFHTDVKAVAEGIFLTLACRPLGALVFGWLAEKYGRGPILMLTVASYSAVQLAPLSHPTSRPCWRCVRCSASRWAGSGAWVRHWRSRRCPQGGAAFSPDCCRKAT